MKIKFISLLISIFFCNVISAQKRDLDDAKEIAYAYISNLYNQDIRKKSLYCITEGIELGDKIEELKVNPNSPDKSFYVFSDTTSKNLPFIIISGDERMKDVLAYGDRGTWNNDNMPEALIDLLNLYRKQYEWLQETNVPKERFNEAIDIPSVTPLIQTTWDQGIPYNSLCPNGCPSGCVAMAMSQIMNYYKYPTTGTGSFSYISYSKKYNCSYNFSNTVFQWNLMQDSYSDVSFNNTEPENAVAQISYACGVSVGMDYDVKGSGAYMSDVPYALVHFFNYNPNISFCDRTYYNTEEWYSMICNELLNGRPVLYGGVDRTKGGHAFIIDGSKADTHKFHVNWGWGGDFDGFFELDALNPSNYKFSYYQDMVINITPEITGTYRDVFYADKFTASNNISVGKDIVFYIYDVYCYSSQSSYVVSDAQFKGDIGIGLFDSNFSFMSTLASYEIDGLNNFYGFEKLAYNVHIQESMFPKDGTYYIAPYVQYVEASNPTRIRTTGGETDYIVVNVENGIVEGQGNIEPEVILSEWNEDFETDRLPSYWSQEIELGNGTWQHTYILKPSESKPAAAHGNGYVYLEYSKGLDLDNNSSITKLVSDYITLQSDNLYNMSFNYRKYATQPESHDILSLYYEKDNKWQLIKEISVVNQGDWNQSTIQLPVTDNLRFAFEGNPSRGSKIFLDNIRIYKREDKVSAVIDIENLTPCLKKCMIYTISGTYIMQTTTEELKSLHLPFGLYIVKTDDKTFKYIINK